ncbi:MAG: hypothetical protein KJO36_07830 [Acidimicrobiia bacterium]|nr:hypothetical protein [Acidimicrobiia bacterium]
MDPSKLDEDAFVAYADRTASFISSLRPQDALELHFSTVIELLRTRYGPAVDTAMSQEATDPRVPGSGLSRSIRSRVAAHTDSSWMRRTNMVGVNLRTVGSFAGLVKYLLTVPSAFDSVHLLPLWEPGVAESLYGPASWNLSTEFLSEEMAEFAPYLTTPERQLRATTNLLHVMGRTVGMDVIPHTDRYSEMALGQPAHFEWMQVRNGRITDHSDAVERAVSEVVYQWLLESGPAVASNAELLPGDTETLFDLPESDRAELLFGLPGDRQGRNARRLSLIQRLKWFGYEPVPATMGVPFRGIHVADSPPIRDEHGMLWHDYDMDEPRFMSRVFTPLARYKLYERIDANAHWEIDFQRPRVQTWEYVVDHFAQVAISGNFDFMRGDMSHVQMRPQGVPADVDAGYYDILRAVKEKVQASRPSFGYFAESFLPARDVFQYGEELDHLDASLADATLGDLQSTVVGDHEYLRRFRRYLDDLATRECAPAYGVMTGDKDDPRFDEYYRDGNALRYLSALLLTDMPSYTALGFEIRDVRHSPAENERYTKLFVFRERGDHNVYPSKARHDTGYIWGENEELFETITAIRLFAESILPQITGSTTRWLVPPDATTLRGTAVWTQEHPRYVIATNADLEHDSGFFGIPALEADVVLSEVFSTHGGTEEVDRRVVHNGHFHMIENLQPGEARVYQVT